MDFPSKILENTVNEISKLPGIGKRTALRLALHILKQPENQIDALADSIKTLRKANKILLDKRLTGEELNAPLDHYLFTELTANGFTLGTPIPGRSTHCEKNELSPLINWYEYVKQLQI